MSGPLRFLSRWSRLKRQAAGAAAAVPEPAAAAASAGAPPAPVATLEAIEQLGIDSDFGAYMQAEVSESLRRQALKKLFSDPHFNVMDGLDTYIDDYSISDPIPDEMLAGLNQMQRLFPSVASKDACTEPVPPTAADASAAPTTESPSASCDISQRDGQNDPQGSKQPTADTAD